MQSAPIRVGFYIDGLNVYHRIREYHRATGINCRWLDYRGLCESLLHPDEKMAAIYWFTALGGGADAAGKLRHKLYIEALESRGVCVVKGYFTKTQQRMAACPDSPGNDGMCQVALKEEKQTDVNIAVQMLADAFNSKFDKCFLMSGDNDFAPVLRQVNLMGKLAGVVTPPYEQMTVKMPQMTRLKEEAINPQTGNRMIINLEFPRLREHLLPPTIRVGRRTIFKLPEWSDLNS